jgi:hypothetical protein
VFVVCLSFRLSLLARSRYPKNAWLRRLQPEVPSLMRATAEFERLARIAVTVAVRTLADPCWMQRTSQFDYHGAGKSR